MLRGGDGGRVEGDPDRCTGGIDCLNAVVEGGSAGHTRIMVPPARAAVAVALEGAAGSLGVVSVAVLE